MRFILFAGLIAGMIFQTGCGLSPLLHHSEAPADPVLSASQGASSCPLQFSSLGLCASLEWMTPPSSEDGGVMRLRFWNAEGGSPQGPYATPIGAIHVSLWMPKHGHGSSPVELTPLKDDLGGELPGQFAVSQMFFIMPGAWQIRVRIKDGTTILGEASLAYVAS